MLQTIVRNQNELDGFFANYDETQLQCLSILAEGEITLNAGDKDASMLDVCIRRGEQKLEELSINILSPCGRVEVTRANVNIEWKMPNKSEDRPKLVIDEGCCIKVCCSGVDITIRNSDHIVIYSLNSLFVNSEKDIIDVQISHSIVSTQRGGVYNAHFYVSDNSELFCVTDNKNCVIALQGHSQVDFGHDVQSPWESQIIAFDSSVVKFYSQDQEEEFRSVCSFYDNAHMILENKAYDNIIDYCEKNDIEHTNTYGYFYKVVKQTEDGKLMPVMYSTDTFLGYKVGEYVYPDKGFDETVEQCASGIHCGGLNFVLRQFGEIHPKTPLAVLKLRVEFNDFAPYAPGRVPEKLRCKKAFVEKIVNPEDLGARKVLIGK